MDILLAVLRYGLITTIAVEAVIAGRALFQLVMEKSRLTEPTPAQE